MNFKKEIAVDRLLFYAHFRMTAHKFRLLNNQKVEPRRGQLQIWSYDQSKIDNLSNQTYFLLKLGRLESLKYLKSVSTGW